MPKINVYLPDDLAAAVKETGISVSPVCQKALEEAVRRVRNLRRAVTIINDPNSESQVSHSVENRLWEYMTLRLKDANRLVKEAVEPLNLIETKDLLVGLLDEGENMAVRVLQSLGVDVDDLRSAAKRVITRESPSATSSTTNPSDQADDEDSDVESGDALWRRLSQPARSAIASALETSVDLGHNYLGCEHMLFGLVNDVESGAGRVLNSFGVELANLRRAVNGAVAGYNLRRDAEKKENSLDLDEIESRLRALEDRVNDSK